MQSSLPQVYQCSASLQSGQFFLPAMLQSSRLPYVTPWRQVLCYTMYLDGSSAILLLPSGFAEVQLAVLEFEVVNCFDDDLRTQRRTGIRFWLFFWCGMIELYYGSVELLWARIKVQLWGYTCQKRAECYASHNSLDGTGFWLCTDNFCFFFDRWCAFKHGAFRTSASCEQAACSWLYIAAKQVFESWHASGVYMLISLLSCLSKVQNGAMIIPFI